MLKSHPRLTVFLPALIWLLLVASFALDSHAKQPQPDPNAELPVETLVAETTAGQFTFTVEVADTNEERAKGLMFRESMVPTHGMLFKFDALEPIYMWMKDTPLPLDMIFIRPSGIVARIEHDTTPLSLNVIASGEPVSHVLELNAGMSRLIGLKPGDLLVHPHFKQSQ